MFSLEKNINYNQVKTGDYWWFSPQTGLVIPGLTETVPLLDFLNIG